MVGILILIAMLALCLAQFSGGPHGFQQPASHLCAAEGKAEETVFLACARPGSCVPYIGQDLLSVRLSVIHESLEILLIPDISSARYCSTPKNWSHRYSAVHKVADVRILGMIVHLGFQGEITTWPQVIEAGP